MMAGWVAKSTRFTKPVADVVRTSLVAAPTFRVMAYGSLVKVAVVAVIDFAPAVPVITRPPKLAVPELEALLRVPVKVAPLGVSVTIAVASLPVETTFPSWS